MYMKIFVCELPVLLNFKLCRNCIVLLCYVFYLIFKWCPCKKSALIKFIISEASFEFNLNTDFCFLSLTDLFCYSWLDRLFCLQVSCLFIPDKISLCVYIYIYLFPPHRDVDPFNIRVSRHLDERILKKWISCIADNYVFFQLFWCYSLTQPKSRTAEKRRGKCKEGNSSTNAELKLNTNMRGEWSMFFRRQPH